MLVEEKEYVNNHISSNKFGVLNQIHKVDVNIAIWNRDYKISHLLYKKLNESLTFEFKESGSIRHLNKLLEDFFIQKLAWQGELYNDIKRILKLFKEISNAKYFKILLSTINTNMCSKFHTDINDLRLLCTYSGPGTLYLKEDNYNIKLDGVNINKFSQVKNNILQVPTGDVAILKGALYPLAGTQACMHRSPTIEETKQNRIILKIDTNNLFSELNF